jgi:hypothetical protein
MSKELMIYRVEKEEILGLDYSRISDFFGELVKLKKKAMGNAVILVHGYDDIPDELYSIPEVREWAKGLIDKYPHLFYYMNFDLEGHIWLLMSITDYVSVTTEEKLSPEELLKMGPNFPKVRSAISIDSDVLDNLKSNIKRYGSKINDLKGANLVVRKLDNVFGGI